MKYGKLFTNFIDKFNFVPSSNRVSTLPYNELKRMAKEMYAEVKEFCEFEERKNPLDMYMRQSKQELIMNVYQALNIVY